MHISLRCLDVVDALAAHTMVRLMAQQFDKSTHAPSGPQSAWSEVHGLKEVARLPLFAPRLARSIFAKPHLNRVVVMPGFGTGDRSTALIRRGLISEGFRASGWGIGKNHGDAERQLSPLLASLDVIYEQERQKNPAATIDLVGWSLGGYLAREAARERPQYVRRVVTMAAPIIGGPKYTAAANLFRKKGLDLDDIERRVAEREERNPLRVKVYALYSKRDGVVDWKACLDHDCAQTEHIEIDATHWTIGISQKTIKLIARCLNEKS